MNPVPLGRGSTGRPRCADGDARPLVRITVLGDY